MSVSRVVYLSGGVGGARLAEGLAAVLPDGALTVIVNTGDDFEHWGLHISPDVDTVMYTLAGIHDRAQGWGVRDDTFEAFEVMRGRGGADWFRLGDRDLATHVMRTQLLEMGEPLSAITARLCESHAVATRILPMTDGSVRTMIEARAQGTLPFQDWLVRLRAEPVVKEVWFRGDGQPAPGVLDALSDAQLVVIGPSNPYVSIDPILSMSGVRAALDGRRIVAVSPIVSGKAVKGPLVRMLRELSDEGPGPGAIARHYGPLLAGMVVEAGDETDVEALPVIGAATVMRSAEDSAALARRVLAFASELT